MCRSEWHRPARVTRTSASPGPTFAGLRSIACSGAPKAVMACVFMAALCDVQARGSTFVLALTRATSPPHAGEVASLQMRFDEPEVLVHLARDAGEQVGGVLVAGVVGGVDAGARQLAEG